MAAPYHTSRLTHRDGDWLVVDTRSGEPLTADARERLTDDTLRRCGADTVGTIILVERGTATPVRLRFLCTDGEVDPPVRGLEWAFWYLYLGAPALYVGPEFRDGAPAPPKATDDLPELAATCEIRDGLVHYTLPLWRTGNFLFIRTASIDVIGPNAWDGDARILPVAMD